MIDYIAHLEIEHSDASAAASQLYRELKAARRAAHFHAGQWYGPRPYMYHLSAVREVLRSFSVGGDLAVAAWLHDVLEDTSATPHDLQEDFGPEVLALVDAVTGVGESRKERNLSVYRKIAQLPRAATLKVADRIANLEESYHHRSVRHCRMYVDEYPEFAGALERHCSSRHWVVLSELVDDVRRFLENAG